MTKFTTLQAHLGDRPQQPYLPGETREVDDENMVKHLTQGDDPVLGDYDSKAHAAFEKAQKERLKNKAEGAAEDNKSDA